MAGGITGVAGGLTGGLKGGLGAAMKLGGGALNMGFNANQWAAELAHAAALRDIGPLVGQVEIAWRGKTERSCFPLPFEINYLPDNTRAAFLEEVRALKLVLVYRFTSAFVVPAFFSCAFPLYSFCFDMTFARHCFAGGPSNLRKANESSVKGILSIHRRNETHLP